MECLVRGGAEGIIWGCTEISLLFGDADGQMPLFDTTGIHAVAAVESTFASEALLLIEVQASRLPEGRVPR